MADIMPDPRQDPRVIEGAWAICRTHEGPCRCTPDTGPCAHCVSYAAPVVAVIDARARQFLQALDEPKFLCEMDLLGR